MDISAVATAVLTITVQLVNGFYDNTKITRLTSNPTRVNTTNTMSIATEECIVPKSVDGTRLEFLYCNSRLGNNRSIRIEFGNESSIIDYWIDGLPLKVVTHGWLASCNNFTGVFCIKTAYVNTGGYNVITVDWSSIAQDILYPVPAVLTKAVGSRIAEFLKHVISLTGILVQDIHLIGHSLGAHVMGSCGFHFRLKKIGRITGLDPASPGFKNLLVHLKRLSKDDAEFVDVFHTSGGTLGLKTPIGHVDFYPNGGIAPQPGCDIQEFISCSHSRSHELYADSVYYRKSLVGIKFLSLNDFKIEKDTNYTKAWMGHDALFSTRGIFYGKTNDVSPYGVLFT